MSSEEITNDRVEAHILANLPASFGSLVRKSEEPDLWYRPIDRNLQRLRKAKRIGFRREGRESIWFSL